MVKDLFKNYIYPIATLAGSIIGVGFLSLPYITVRVGVWPVLFYFAVLVGLVLYLHVIFGNICLKTPDHKRFPGFVGFYLGSVAKKITVVSILLGSFGLCVVYVIVGAQFLTAIVSPLFGGSYYHYIFLYFLLGAIAVYFNVNIISKIELFTLLFLLTAFVVVLVKGMAQIHPQQLFGLNPSLNFSEWFLPYGPIIFSLWGVGLIPEVEEMLSGRKKLLKRIIVIGTLIPAVAYVLFVFLVVSISGNATTESALLGLKHFLGPWVFLVALSVGFFTTFAAFITQGLFLKKTFVYDLGTSNFFAWAVTCTVPVALFLLGFNSFIPLISLMGGVLFGINGIFILLMHKKIGGRALIAYPLAIVFLLGIVYEIVYFIK